MDPGDLDAVCARGREVFGADRGWLLRSLRERAPECAWIVDGAGYSFGRPGHLYHQLGPVVAEDPGTARDLAASALGGLGGRTVAEDVPRFDAEWVEWLTAVGFVEERPFVRMFVPGHLHPGTPRRQYAICGPEFV